MTGLWGNTAARHCARQSIQERLRQIDRERMEDFRQRFKTSASPAGGHNASLGGQRGTPGARGESVPGDNFPASVDRGAFGHEQAGAGRTSS